jgi:dTDP-glucose 4,6-dehydratase
MTGKCLITGSSGFLGRWLRSTLLRYGFEIRGFDNQPAGVGDEIIGNLLDKQAVDRACTDVQAVCHLAALQSSHQYTWGEFYAANVAGTEFLLQSCLRHHVKHIVFFSTELVYGRQTSHRVKENAEIRPYGFYGRSKMMAEDLSMKYAQQGLKVTILRPCNIMGPGKRRVVDQLFDRIDHNAIIPLVGGRQRPCQFVDVRDVTEIVAEILTREVGGVYNVGSLYPPVAEAVYSKLIFHARSSSRLVPVPAGMFRNGFRLLDVLKLSPLTCDQYYRLTDPWIIDASQLLDRIKYSLKYDEITSITDTYDAYVADAQS